MSKTNWKKNKVANLIVIGKRKIFLIVLISSINEKKKNIPSFGGK